MKSITLFLFALLALFAAAKAQQQQGPPPIIAAWAWVDSTGEIHNFGGDFNLTVSRLSVGHFCFNTDGPALNFSSVSATIQTGSSSVPVAGLVSVNTGFEDDCSSIDFPYAIYTFDVTGKLLDQSFSFVVFAHDPEEQNPPPQGIQPTQGGSSQSGSPQQGGRPQQGSQPQSGSSQQGGRPSRK